MSTRVKKLVANVLVVVVGLFALALCTTALWLGYGLVRGGRSIGYVLLLLGTLGLVFWALATRLAFRLDNRKGS